ncbi:hypothetical protein C3L33_03856, partial [Rhododendron williamsianum]
MVTPPKRPQGRRAPNPTGVERSQKERCQRNRLAAGQKHSKWKDRWGGAVDRVARHDVLPKEVFLAFAVAALQVPWAVKMGPFWANLYSLFSPRRSLGLREKGLHTSVGRTARAGRTGVAISLISPTEVVWFLQIEKHMEKQIPLFPAQEEEALLLLERVSEAKRISEIVAIYQLWLYCKVLLLAFCSMTFIVFSCLGTDFLPNKDDESGSGIQNEIVRANWSDGWLAPS